MGMNWEVQQIDPIGEMHQFGKRYRLGAICKAEGTDLSWL